MTLTSRPTFERSNAVLILKALWRRLRQFSDWMDRDPLSRDQVRRLKETPFVKM
jgi:hypothetical protein